MAKVIWTANALENLDDIAEYIAKDSQHYAEITVAKLFSSTKILKTYPLSGRIVPEFELEHIREIIEVGYRVVYQVTPAGNIEVLSVRHGSKLMKNP